MTTLVYADYLQDEQIASLAQLQRDEPDAAVFGFCRGPLERFAAFTSSEPFYSISQSTLLVLFGLCVGLCIAAATGWLA